MASSVSENGGGGDDGGKEDPDAFEARRWWVGRVVEASALSLPSGERRLFAPLGAAGDDDCSIKGEKRLFDASGSENVPWCCVSRWKKGRAETRNLCIPTVT